MKITVRMVRASYFFGIEPGEFTDDKSGKVQVSYSTKGIFPKDAGEIYKVCTGAISTVARDQWKDKAGAILKNLRATDKVFLHDGDLQIDGDGEIKDGYKGSWFVSCSQSDITKAPKIYNGEGVRVTPENVGTLKDLPYSGCYVDLLIDVWAQDNKYGKRVNARFLAAVFKEDGEAFGAGALSDEDAREALGIEKVDPLEQEQGDEPADDEGVDDLFSEAG